MLQSIFVFLGTLWAVGLANDVTLTDERNQALLTLHNNARMMEPASNMVEMSWDANLASEAQSWTDACHFEHQKDQSWGENLAAKSYRSGNNVTALLADMFQLWTAEEVYNPGKTFEECCSMSSYKCCHYTQVIWATSTKVGCGLTLCDPMTTKQGSMNSVVYLACYYNPRGNVPTASYTWDWKPYIILS